MSSTEEESRVVYCKERNIHHLFELLATKILLDKPKDHFQYLRNLLTSVEESEKNKKVHDPTQIRVMADEETGASGGPPRRKVTLAMFGIDNAGKTALLSAMGGSIDENTTPTVGFTPMHFQTPTTDLCIFDLGGARNFRGIWVHYLHDCHGLLYVVDSADEPRVEESLDALREVVGHEYMRGKPVAILANKKDVVGSQLTGVVPDGFLQDVLEKHTPHRVFATCAIQEDSEVDAAVEWILEAVLERYDVLVDRVKCDTQAMQAEKKRKLAERLVAMQEGD